MARASGVRLRPGTARSRRTFGGTLVGLPSQVLDSDTPTYAGRKQSPLGRWWEGHPRLLRALALLALAWLTAYLIWRVGWGWEGASPWLGAMLLVAEGYGLWNLAMLTWLSWRLPESRRPAATPGHRIDVYVCTYDEPVHVLEATLVGCAALTYPHTTYLLDDGRRPEMAALAERLGARYMTRPDNAHAKAGNINHALRRTDGELVLTLDADHVPLPDALDAIVGYFDAEDVALVQTPHEFYNHDSIQHYEVGRHEQSVFFGVVCPGKDRHNASFWCGSGGLIRRSALLAVGGVATETIAEDFHTTIKLHRAGWRSLYHNEVLVQGLAPHDLASYLIQRDRWARGNLSVFGTPESPLRARGLSPLQRLSYLASLTAYLAGPMRLLSLVTLAAVLWTGQLPMHATAAALALLWAPATLLSICAGSALTRGYQRVADTTHFELCTAEIFARALRCVVRPGRTRFRVTPKEGVDLGGIGALRHLRAVVIIAILLAVGIPVRLIDEAGVNLVPDLHGIALWPIPAVAAVELRRVARTVTIVTRRRQVRTVYRMPLLAPVAVSEAGVDDAPVIGRSRDISPSGIGLELPAPMPVASALTLTVKLPGLASQPLEWIEVQVEVQSCRSSGERWTVGTRITGCGDDARRRIVEYCYLVSQRDRLRGARPLALPVPVEPDAAVALRTAA